MAELTQEEKKRIEAEEIYRAKVREEIKEEKTEDIKPKKKGPGCLTLIVILFFCGIILSAVMGLSTEKNLNSNSSNSSSASPTPAVEEILNATVDFTGTQFVITNNDKFDCRGAKMEINGGLLKGGYVLEGYILEAGKVYTVGAMQFTTGDGTRFNPINIKPKNFWIGCKGNSGTYTSSWYGVFN